MSEVDRSVIREALTLDGGDRSEKAPAWLVSENESESIEPRNYESRRNHQRPDPASRIYSDELPSTGSIEARREKVRKMARRGYLTISIAIVVCWVLLFGIMTWATGSWPF